MRNRMGAGVAAHPLEWDDLRTFLMIARHHTLSAAARAIGVQQPTMGRRLAALEQRAGARLLQKTPEGYVLTEAGEAVLGNIERIELEALAVQRQIAGKDVRLEGVIRLTTIETLAAEILSPVIAEFRRTHPRVQVEIVAATRSLNLSRREADVALRVARFTQPDLVVRKVGAIAYGLYAAPGYLERHGPFDAAGSGEGHALIMTEQDLLEMPEMAWLRAVAPRAEVALATNSRLLHRAAARDGIGVACLARYLGDSVPELVRLAAPPEMPPPVRDLFLGVHSDMRHTARIRAFTTILQDGLRRAGHRLHPGTEG
jgi:DNA-binding transcriptional LysR family regulator